MKWLSERFTALLVVTIISGLLLICSGPARTDEGDVKPMTKLPEGKIETDQLEIQPLIQAYRSIEKIADRIAVGLKGKKILLLTDKGLLDDLVLLDSTKAQLRLLIRDLTLKNKGPEKISGLTTALLFLGDLVGIFRSDTVMKGLKVAIDEDALMACVARSLRREGATVFCGSLGVRQGEAKPGDSLDDLINTCITDYHKEKEKVVQRNKTSNLEDQARWKALSDMFQDFRKHLIKVDTQAGGETLYARLRRAEIIDSKGFDYFLLVKPIAGGGTTRTIKWIFNPGTVSFSGGAVVCFLLLDKNHELVESNTLHAHRGYERVREEGAGYIEDNVGR